MSLDEWVIATSFGIVSVCSVCSYKHAFESKHMFDSKELYNYFRSKRTFEVFQLQT